jgi:signal transduction histidine kinase
VRSSGPRPWCTTITTRKRDEAELRRSHTELERFADIAAHDLREPLMAIAQLTSLLERGIESQREWTLTVADNGPGVSERNRERIFELFARGAVDGEAPGTGLGLAVCRKVIDLHGGRIWVEPAPGGGSAFRLTLPA